MGTVSSSRSPWWWRLGSHHSRPAPKPVDPSELAATVAELVVLEHRIAALETAVGLANPGGLGAKSPFASEYGWIVDKSGELNFRLESIDLARRELAAKTKRH